MSRGGGRKCGLVEEDVFLVSKCLAWIPLKDFYLDCVARSEMCDYLILSTRWALMNDFNSIKWGNTNSFLRNINTQNLSYQKIYNDKTNMKMEKQISCAKSKSHISRAAKC